MKYVFTNFSHFQDKFLLKVQEIIQFQMFFKLYFVIFFSGLFVCKCKSLRTPVVVQKPHFVCDSPERVHEGVRVRAVDFTLQEELQLI